MKRIFYLNVMLCFFVFCSQVQATTGSEKEQVTEVSGIFYLDNASVTIKIKDGLIEKIVRTPQAKDANSAAYIAPGLFDNQVNGYMEVAFAGEGLTVAGVRRATEGLWKAGVTTYLPTLTTNSHELLVKNFQVMAESVKDPQISLSIPGFHLEGPYISPIDGYRGAHIKEWVRPPDWQEFMKFYEAADQKIIQVSLAPEIEGAFDFIQNCRKLGIVVGLAHHNGSAEIVKKAVDAGAAISTHLGNGCANMIHRHQNPLWPQLAEGRLLASIIVDGFHLRPEEVQTFWKAKSTDGIVITSDVTSLAGMPAGVYTRRGRTVELTADGMIKLPSQNVLAGSASPITKGVGNIMRFTGCTLADAVHMATRNPARLYGLDDRGEIRPGKRADLVVFTIDAGSVTVHKTILAGEVVFSAE
jgi:N-acetylglucosamine-6-phosphate deacetylase